MAKITKPNILIMHLLKAQRAKVIVASKQQVSRNKLLKFKEKIPQLAQYNTLIPMVS
jgi:hypothetical protein